jgi:hypothetical protein
MSRSLALLVVLAGCGKSTSKPSTESTGGSATPPPAAAAVLAKVNPAKKQLCSQLDRDALATALGVPGLAKIGNGTRVDGGGAPAELICTFYEVSKRDGGLGLSIRLRAATDLEAKDLRKRFTWEPFDGLGRPARIGRQVPDVHLQTLAKGLRVIVRVGHPELPAGELEQRAVAAARAVIAQLPADAAAQLE